MTNPMLAELDELEPCPFCGREPAVRIPTDKDGFAVHVSCRCGAQLYGRNRHFAGEQEAIAAWNRRTHATLADMAKRLEAAERDAKGERSESWEVWQDDMCVAGSDSLADAQHYMMMYGQDGPVKMVHVVTFRSDVIETVPADQLAIDATQEGEG